MKVLSVNVRNQIAGAISLASSRRTSEKEGFLSESFGVLSCEHWPVW
jgi:hypothetical protein